MWVLMMPMFMPLMRVTAECCGVANSETRLNLLRRLLMEY